MTNLENLPNIVEPLLAWFKKNARILPWREQPTPYYIWISEIMLQQTRVEAVKPYFYRFVEELPDVKALAECREDRLLKLWEGLGYYNRVRNMQKAAVMLMEEYNGNFPNSVKELQKLPGIGSYTAGAIASNVYGVPVPSVDGNVLRVVSRLIENEEDILKPAVKRMVEEILTEIMPENNPGMFNQALMELGATVCVPNKAPECSCCPVSEYCMAYRHDRLDEIPKRVLKQKRRIEKRTVLVIRDGTYAVIRKRPAKGLLAGLYELPNLEGHLTQERVLEYVKEHHLNPLRIRPLKEAKHIFSHVEWRMTGYLILVEEAESVQPEKNWLYVEPERTQREYPIPAAFSAYSEYLQIKIGREYVDELSGQNR